MITHELPDLQKHYTAGKGIAPVSRNIIAVCDDLFFASKIRGTAEQHGVTVRFGKSVEGVLADAAAEKPSLVIIDLNSQRCDPFEVATSLKSHPEFATLSLIGFFAHVQTDLQRRADAAGFDRVMPRSLFTKNLSQIVSGTE